MKHEVKIYRRCNIEFEADNISNCLYNIEINQVTNQFLLKPEFDCLYMDCLQYYNQLVITSNNHPFPIKKQMFIKGLHFYQKIVTGYLLNCIIAWAFLQNN